MSESKLSKKYQIVVPKAVRQQLKLLAGSRISLYPLDSEHAIIMKKPISSVKRMTGLGKDVWKALGGADHYIHTERALWKK